jgi:prevent-host-death family protein
MAPALLAGTKAASGGKTSFGAEPVCGPGVHTYGWAFECEVDDAPFIAILMAMAASADHMPLVDVKNRLSDVVERLERERCRAVITKHGRPAAVVLSIEDLESLEETLDILGDQPAVARLRESLDEAAGGRTRVMSREDAIAQVRAVTDQPFAVA